MGRSRAVASGSLAADGRGRTGWAGVRLTWGDAGERTGRAGAGVVGVVGARGGAGASVVAAALARQLSVAGPCALVDMAVGGGLDTLLGLEEEPGLRWPDLADARGQVDGAQLARALMRWRGCTVLSGDRRRAGPPPGAAVGDVLDALTRCHGSVVLDLDRSEVCGPASVAAACRVVLVVVPRDLAGVAGALAVRDRLAGTVHDLRLVVRGPAPGGLGAGELALAVGLPVSVVVAAERRLAAGIERGAGPARPAGALARATRRLALELM